MNNIFQNIKISKNDTDIISFIKDVSKARKEIFEYNTIYETYIVIKFHKRKSV